MKRRKNGKARPSPKRKADAAELADRENLLAQFPKEHWPALRELHRWSRRHIKIIISLMIEIERDHRDSYQLTLNVLYQMLQRDAANIGERIRQTRSPILEKSPSIIRPSLLGPDGKAIA